MTTDSPPMAQIEGRWVRRLRIAGFVVVFCGGWLLGHAGASLPASMPSSAAVGLPAHAASHPSVPRWLQTLRASSSSTP